MKRYGRPKNWEYWEFSVAIVNHVCPKCKAPKEYHCQTPKGKPIWPSHKERTKLITNKEIERTSIYLKF